MTRRCDDGWRSTKGCEYILPPRSEYHLIVFSSVHSREALNHDANEHSRTGGALRATLVQHARLRDDARQEKQGHTCRGEAGSDKGGDSVTKVMKSQGFPYERSSYPRMMPRPRHLHGIFMRLDGLPDSSFEFALFPSPTLPPSPNFSWNQDLSALFASPEQMKKTPASSSSFGLDNQLEGLGS